MLFFVLDLIKNGLFLLINKYCFNNEQGIVTKAFGVLICQLMSIDVPTFNQQNSHRGSLINENSMTQTKVSQLVRPVQDSITTQCQNRLPAADEILALYSDEETVPVNYYRSYKSVVRHYSPISGKIPAVPGSPPKRVQFKSPLITVCAVEPEESNSDYFSDSSDDGDAVRVCEVTDESDSSDQSSSSTLITQSKFWRDYRLSIKSATIC